MASTVIKNWDNKTWLSSKEYIKSFNSFITKQIKLNKNSRILDIGCGSGHYLRSLKNTITKNFDYVGIDNYQIFLNKAKQAWEDHNDASFIKGSAYQIPAKDREFDVVLCSNLLLHLPSIIKPIEELTRVSSRLILIRTMIGERSFRIQEVYNKNWWPLSGIEPKDEFKDDGEPEEFAHRNIYSREYFSSVIRRFSPRAKIKYIEDDMYSGEGIEESAKTEGLVNATKMLAGKQVSGYIIVPWTYVVVEIAQD